MEERSLRVYTDKTFFTKITNTITKMLVPTKIGINGMLISIKRNNLLKSYEAYVESAKEDDVNRKEVIDRYNKQLEIYSKALEKLTGKKVKEAYIYLFGIEEEVLYKF